jgi:hypothetical protein
MSKSTHMVVRTTDHPEVRLTRTAAGSTLPSMPIRILDTGLTARQEEYLIAEWTACRLIGEALQAEIDHATYSRSFETQMKLWEENKAQGDKCHSVLVELRARRKARSDSRN